VSSKHFFSGKWYMSIDLPRTSMVVFHRAEMFFVVVDIGGCGTCCKQNTFTIPTTFLIQLLLAQRKPGN
jgi:hypothetical protein